MKERPIIFSEPMVRAILAGKKTQTRRTIAPQPTHAQHHKWHRKLVYEGEHRLWCWKEHTFENLWDEGIRESDRARLAALNPHGVAGDRLWVRETWQAWRQTNVEYDEWEVEGDQGRIRDSRIEYASTSESTGPWRSPIHMPRWASRITLEITEVRVQRLQDLSEKDAWAEGIDDVDGLIDDASIRRAARAAGCSHEDAKATFGALWDEINGKRAPWASNPWVWAITFRRLA